MHHHPTTTAGGSVVSDGLKAHGRDAGDASADRNDGGFSRHRSPRRPIGRRGLWERSRDAVCRRASVSASYRVLRPTGANPDSVPSVLRQQDARGQTRCSVTQTSKHDGATFVYVIRTCMRERLQQTSPAPAQAESTESMCRARQREARRSLRGRMVMQLRSRSEAEA